MKKKILALILVITMIASSIASFASSGDGTNIKIVKDNSIVRIVEGSDDNFIYRMTLNKVDNTAQMSIEDKSSKVVNVSKIAQLGMYKEESKNPTNELIMPLATSLQQNTYTNWEYTKTFGTPNQWELRRPGENIFNWYFFQTAETTSNRSYLVQFQNAVQNVNNLEVPLVASVGVAGLFDILSVASVFAAISSGGTLTGAAWAVITTGLSMSGIATTLLIDYNSACTQAFDAYYEVFKRKS